MDCYLINQLNFEKPELRTCDYIDILFPKRCMTGLDKFMEKFYQINDIPSFYRGKTKNVLLCKDVITNRYEIHDMNDLIMNSDDELVEENELTVVNNKWRKPVIYLKKLTEIYYKWESKKGVYLLFSENEILSLTDKDRRYLRID